MKRLFAKAIVTSALLGGMLVHAADTIKVGGFTLFIWNYGYF